MTLQQEAKDAVKEAGSQRAAAKKLGIARSTLVDRLKGKSLTKRSIPATPSSSSNKKTLTDFRKEYDKDFIVPNKIKDAIKALGPDGWEYEVPFSRGAGVSPADMGAYREEFADFIVHLRRDSKRVWAGSKKLATQLREMV